VTIVRDGLPVTSLVGSPETYTDTVPGLQSYTYAVHGSLRNQDSTSVECTVAVADLPSVVLTRCESDATNMAHLEWTTPIVYDEIRVVVSGEVAANLQGDATAFHGQLPGVGTFTYEIIGILGPAESAAVPCTVASETKHFLRGDTNGSGSIDIADAVYLLGYLFRGNAAPPCMEAANVNDDASVDIGDAVYLLSYLFREEAPPPAPFPTCGPDPDPDGSLGCLNSPGCSGG
jgi:hypothetical protein